MFGGRIVECIEVPAASWWLPVVTCRKGCPLALAERLAWSSLIRPYRGDRPASARRVGRETGLGRDAAGAALGRLAAAKLASHEPAGWRACEPQPAAAGWFVHRGDQGADLCHRYRFWKYPVPSPVCPLTTAQAAVLWLLASLQRGGGGLQSAQGLAALLHISPATATGAMRRLVELGVLTTSRQGGGRSRSRVRFREPLPPGFDGWWMAVPGREGDEAAVVAEKEVADEELPAVPPSAPPPPAVRPAPKASPAEAGLAPAPKPPAAPPGLTDRERREWEECLDEAGVGPRYKGTVLRLAADITDALDGVDPPDPERAVGDAYHAHDPAKANGSQDCGPLLVYRLRKRRDEARAERRAGDLKRENEAEVFAPLAHLGLVRALNCPACGVRLATDIGHLPEDRWPAGVREVAAALRGLEGVRTWDVEVGPRGRRCAACGDGGTGVVLWCRREVIVGRSYVIVFGYRAFPDDEPLPEAPRPVVEPASACGASVDEADILDLLGPPPAWRLRV